MVSLLMMAGLAHAAGFQTSASWISSHGPDAYGELRAAALASPGLEVGVLAVGGTRSALFATGARTVRLGERVSARGELRFGMAEATGAVPGFEAELRVGLGGVVAVAGGGYTGGLGGRGLAGVDAPLTDTLTLSPRIRAETWAGDRDLALRAALGLSHQRPGGLRVGVEASAGGRDVFHLGPGITLSLGRTP